MFAARIAEESSGRSVRGSLPRLVRVADEAKPTATSDTVFDPRLREYSPFDGLLSPPTQTAVPAKAEKPNKSWFVKTRAEWRHALLMELLRVPIMVPIWWAGMALCEVFWNRR